MTIYARNKDLLREIHESKKSFCSYVEAADADYDVIVNSIDEITDELIDQVRQSKASPRGKPRVPVETITPESIVIRVMTFEHIPLDPNRTRKPKNQTESYAKTTFPPFKHYRKQDGQLIEVCRSHWVGGIQNGHFSADHGRINRKLAQMFIIIVNRYSMKSNWRGYSYVDEMRGQALLQLSQIGLQFDESKSDKPFAFYTTSIHNCFLRILGAEKKIQTGRDDLLIAAGQTPSFTRQINNEMEMRFPDAPKPIPKRRGPPTKAEKAAAAIQVNIDEE